MSYRSLSEATLNGKRVLVRLDLNVPIDNGAITDATRIERVIPTLRTLLEKGARVIILSHFGRPKGRDESQSLRPVAIALAKHVGQEILFVTDCRGTEAVQATNAMKDGDIIMLENTRFYKEEEANDPTFVKELASLADVYVNDAFSCAHRAHASTEGLAHHLPAYAGLAMEAELQALSIALEKPTRQVAAIVGGAKVSTKLELLGNLINKVDVLMIGGGMANTFLAAQGLSVGASLHEKDLLVTAQKIMSDAQKAGCEIILPQDGVVTKTFAAQAPHRVSNLKDIEPDEMILDIGPKTISHIEGKLKTIKTLVWNGPFGAFELKPFDEGTNRVAAAAAALTQAKALTSVAGGGDTVAALNQAGASDAFTYVSTAGGAFLEWLEGKTLPGVAALMMNNAQQQARA